LHAAARLRAASAKKDETRKIMSRAFADIAFTPAVRAMQTRLGSRDAYARLDGPVDRRDALTAAEIAYIAERDSFYLATVSETGWPYVQHKGGPAGFLKVLDPRTVGYADYRGNVQYVSDGNLAGNDRVSLILMDYAHSRRLKILGRARIVEAADDPALMERLQDPDYRAPVERAVVIGIEAWDWNCPKHITPRFTVAEIERVLGR
jgi:predicted pyridoxine 5'-phosphate oxidase superfamily flavin-nucleotide-binding protein